MFQRSTEMKFLIIFLLVLITHGKINLPDKSSMQSILDTAKEQLNKGEFDFGDIDKEALAKLVSSFSSSLDDNSIQSLLDTYQPAKKCHFKCSSRKQNPAFILGPTRGCSALFESKITAHEFGSCCDERSVCVGKCGNPKEKCDNEFQSCMSKQCAKIYQMIDNDIENSKFESITLKDLAEKGNDLKSFSSCKIEAKAFFEIARIKGCDSYKAAQKDSCLCFNDEL